MLAGGCNTRITFQEIKRFVEEAGFVNVQVVERKLPMGPWCSDRKLREAGRLAMTSIMEDLGGMSMAVFTRHLHWERDRLEVFLAGVRNEYNERSIHGYWPL